MLSVARPVCCSSVKIEAVASTAVDTSLFSDENQILSLDHLKNQCGTQMYRNVGDEFLKTRKRLSQLQEETDRLQDLVKKALEEKNWKAEDFQRDCSRQVFSPQDCSIQTPRHPVALDTKCIWPEVPCPVQILTLTYTFFGFHSLTVCLFLRTKRAWSMKKQTNCHNTCYLQPLVTRSMCFRSAIFSSYLVRRQWSFPSFCPLFSWKHSFQYRNLRDLSHCKISQEQMKDVLMSSSRAQERVSEITMEDLMRKNRALTEDHVNEFLSSLTSHFDDSMSAVALKLRSPGFSDIQQRILSSVPFHPLNEALFSVFHESALEMELLRKQAVVKGGLDRIRWQSLSKEEYLNDLCCSLRSKIYLTDGDSKRLEVSCTNEVDVVDKVILKDCKWLTDYLLNEIPYLLQEEKKQFCSQVTDEVLRKICNPDLENSI